MSHFTPAVSFHPSCVLSPQLRLHRSDQFFLRHVFRTQGRKYVTVHGILRDDMMDRDEVALPLSPEPRIRLLV